MPRYTYIAKTHPQKTIQGYIEAESEQDAISKVSKMGYFPVSISAADSLLLEPGLRRLKKITRRDLILFTGQLATLSASGISIINAINIVANQTPNKYLKAVLSELVSRIKDGQPLSESLAAYPYLFSNLYSAMIRVGEASGNLKDVLQRLAGFFEKEEELKNSLSASLTYPLFILGVGILSIAVLLVFVIPRLVAMFEDMGQALPLPTKALIGVSGFLRNYWWGILAFILVSVFLLRRVLKSHKGQLLRDRVKLKLPVLGPVILKSEIARLMRTLSLLISSGSPITPALEISGSVVTNQVLQSELKNFKKEINSGTSLSGALKNSRFFNDFVTNIVAIGEETGSLEDALLRIAVDYEKDADNRLKALTRILEPVIILVMGLIVGFIVLSMLLPIFQINLIAK